MGDCLVVVVINDWFARIVVNREPDGDIAVREALGRYHNYRVSVAHDEGMDPDFDWRIKTVRVFDAPPGAVESEGPA